MVTPWGAMILRQLPHATRKYAARSGSTETVVRAGGGHPWRVAATTDDPRAAKDNARHSRRRTGRNEIRLAHRIL